MENSQLRGEILICESFKVLTKQDLVSCSKADDKFAARKRPLIVLVKIVVKKLSSKCDACKKTALSDKANLQTEITLMFAGTRCWPLF